MHVLHWPGFGPLALKGSAASVGHCQSLCCAQSKCDVFTFDTGQGPVGTANCWLKSGGQLSGSSNCAAANKQLNCTSGAVKGGGGGGGGGGGSPDSDPINMLLEWSGIGTDRIGSAAHQQVNYQAALESFVLLKNSHSTLPIPAGKKLAVVGPSAVADFGLLSDYYGDMVCYGPNETSKQKSFGCIPTIGASISALNTAER